MPAKAKMAVNATVQAANKYCNLPFCLNENMGTGHTKSQDVIIV